MTNLEYTAHFAETSQKAVRKNLVEGNPMDIDLWRGATYGVEAALTEMCGATWQDCIPLNNFRQWLDDIEDMLQEQEAGLK